MTCIGYLAGELSSLRHVHAFTDVHKIPIQTDAMATVSSTQACTSKWAPIPLLYIQAADYLLCCTADAALKLDEFNTAVQRFQHLTALPLQGIGSSCRHEFVCCLQTLLKRYQMRKQGLQRLLPS